MAQCCPVFSEPKMIHVFVIISGNCQQKFTEGRMVHKCCCLSNSEVTVNGDIGLTTWICRSTEKNGYETQQGQQFLIM